MKVYQLALPIIAATALSIFNIANAQTIATVNGVVLTQTQLNVLAQGQRLNPEQRATLKERLIEVEILAQAARRQNLQNNPEVKIVMELSNAEILASAYITNYLRTLNISEAEIRATYDEQMSILPDTEYRVRHILVGTEAEADNVIAELRQGRAFSDLVQARSLHTESVAHGGSLDWIHPGIFGDALYGVAKGQYTRSPVQTPVGFHVVFVDDIRPYRKPTLDQAREQIIQIINAQRATEHISRLRQEARIQ